MKSDATQDRLNDRTHQHYVLWFTGDGATTEFRLTKTVGRLDDLHVAVDGAIQRPDDAGTTHDYKVRGHTSGYDGEKNAVTFAVAPPAGKHIYVQVAST